MRVARAWRGGWPRLTLIAATVAWTGLASWLGWKLTVEPPLALELGGSWVFVASRLELVFLWLAGLLAALAVGKRGAWRRRGILVSGLAAVALAGTLLAWPRAAPPRVRLEDPAQAQPTERTTLIVGIDGISWNAILPLVRRGELPTIERLMEEGTYGVLHSLVSTRPSNGSRGYWSPVVWTSIATGVGPEVHGIDDFLIRDPETGSGLAASFHRKAPAFWNLFPRFGQSVGLVGWWATWPAEEVDGVIASSSLGLRGAKRRGRHPGSLDGPQGDLQGLVHPEEMSGELSELFPSPEATRELVHDRVFRLDHYPLDLGPKREVIYSVAAQDRFYLEIARRVIRTTQFPLYAVYFEGPDVVSHHFWRFRKHPMSSLSPGFEVGLPQGFRAHAEAVDRYYRLVDEYMGILLEELPEDATIIVCSDHGFREDPDHSRMATHSGRGVLLARGPGIARGRALNLSLLGSLGELRRGPTHVLDLLPTLLYLHGLPIADALEGKVLTRLFTRGFVEGQPELRIDEYDPRPGQASQEAEGDPELDREYERRLRALGYID